RHLPGDGQVDRVSAGQGDVTPLDANREGNDRFVGRGGNLPISSFKDWIIQQFHGGADQGRSTEGCPVPLHPVDLDAYGRAVRAGGNRALKANDAIEIGFPSDGERPSRGAATVGEIIW